MRLIDADAAIEALTEYGNGRAVHISVEEAVRRIEQLPSAEPDTTTHDSIPAENGQNDEDRTSGDCISRQAESNPLEKCYTCKHVYQRVSDADTLYCRCRKGCRYEEFKPKRSNGNSQWHEGEN